MPELIRRPFVFLRHGQSTSNLNRRIAGQRDVPLTAQGEREARQAYALLGDIDWPLIVASPLERARRTAELATGRAPHCLIGGLKERHWGEHEEQPIPETMPYLLSPEGGESWVGFVTRIVATLNALLVEHETPLVIGHSGLIRVIRYLDSGTPNGPRTDNAVPQWVAPYGIRSWEIRPLREPDVSHLPRLSTTT
ncbi:histidine phosphatase family protein [Chromohalobacter sp. HP20-39]|uniref:histidine phosphatase family protein n=1 Tax=Chromohalobacter sp. HP20-39 TaxID=3079306 RepID=UPI00294AFB80|nr:histidine phosphatase family protein [Chromohalobacter sp. HP20-39]MDV6318492.1 histidine phosphatase family protein [Chromohalobacter sp. HP20-39]